MNCKWRLLAAIVVIFGVFAPGNAALAAAKAHHHHNGHQLLAANKTDGRHVIDKKGHYTTTMEVRGGKVAGVHVVHDTKGPIAVKKYKTHRKLALATVPHVTYASFFQDQDMGTVYIGYAYTDDDGNEEIYWFPYDEVVDGDTGAVEYIPES